LLCQTKPENISPTPAGLPRLPDKKREKIQKLGYFFATEALATKRTKPIFSS
jgi:hypothetical protein